MLWAFGRMQAAAIETNLRYQMGVLRFLETRLESHALTRRLSDARSSRRPVRRLVPIFAERIRQLLQRRHAYGGGWLNRHAKGRKASSR